MNENEEQQRTSQLSAEVILYTRDTLASCNCCLRNHKKRRGGKKNERWGKEVRSNLYQKKKKKILSRAMEQTGKATSPPLLNYHNINQSTSNQALVAGSDAALKYKGSTE